MYFNITEQRNSMGVETLACEGGFQKNWNYSTGRSHRVARKGTEHQRSRHEFGKQGIIRYCHGMIIIFVKKFKKQLFQFLDQSL